MASLSPIFHGVVIGFQICLVWIFITACGPAPTETTDRINLVQALSDTTNSHCFKTADTVRAFEFPRDNGPHPDFRTEWWYYTGNLTTEQGRHFGYQLTFFRQALACDIPQGDSAWRTRQLYFAHFALTNTREAHFHSALRMNRGALSIAGADPLRVWIDQWEARYTPTRLHLRAGAVDMDGLPFSIDLELDLPVRIIPQGDQGLSAKGPGKGNASYYYSLPRIGTRGEVVSGNSRERVKGLTWFDHEWSTTALGREVGGWDWFAVHLDDGRDLMVCQVRRGDGSTSKFGFGSLMTAGGEIRILGSKDFTITPQKIWKSPHTGIPYPAQWEIRLREPQLHLVVRPVVADQEHRHSFSYWEGAARFVSPDKGISGMGYVELTGY